MFINYPSFLARPWAPLAMVDTMRHCDVTGSRICSPDYYKDICIYCRMPEAN